MRARRGAALALGLTAIIASGCGDEAAPYRTVVREQTDAFEALASTLSTVTDAATMSSATAELDKRWQRCEAIKERALELPTPTMAILEQVRPDSLKLEEAFAKVNTQRIRIKALPG